MHSASVVYDPVLFAVPGIQILPEQIQPQNATAICAFAYLHHVSGNFANHHY